MKKANPQLLYFSLLMLSVLFSACVSKAQEVRDSGETRDDSVMNVVLYVSDDHGPDTGAYGNSVIQTPNLDGLAEEGTLFTRAFATTASCSASRSVILSGLHNHRNGQYGHVHDYSHFSSFDHIQSLPNLLAENGYRTARSGKYHVAPEDVYQFDETLRTFGRNTVRQAEEAKDFITADSDTPFFLLMGTFDPHRGGGSATDLPYEPDRFGNVPDGYEGVETIKYDPSEVIVPPWLPDNEATRQELAQYYQSVSRLDQGVGRLTDILKEAGVYEQTLIIYMSDHGMAFPGAKTNVYEPGLLSPLIVRHPRAERRGVTSDAMISWVDITPTILDYAGVEMPTYERHIGQAVIRSHFPEEHGLHGRSILPVLEESAPTGWDAIYASHTFHEIHMYYPMRAVRDRDYKLIWNINHGRPYPNASDLQTSSTWQYVVGKRTNPSNTITETENLHRQDSSAYDGELGNKTVRDYLFRPQFELYDIQEDPFEATNLAHDSEYTEVLERYIAKLKEFQRRTADPWFIHWVYDEGSPGEFSESY